MNNINLKILIIDKDPFLAAILRNKLRNRGFTADLVAKDSEIPKVFKNFKPDIVLCETVFGRFSGFDIMDKFRASAAGKKPSAFIFLARSSPREEQGEALSAGADAFLLKTENTFDEIVTKIYGIAGVKPPTVQKARFKP